MKNILVIARLNGVKKVVFQVVQQFIGMNLLNQKLNLTNYTISPYGYEN